MVQENGPFSTLPSVAAVQSPTASKLRGTASLGCSWTGRPPPPFTCLCPGFKAPPSVPWESKPRRLQLSDLSLKKLRPCSQSWEQTTGRWGAVVWSFVFTAGRVNHSRLKAYLTGEKFLLSRSFQELLSIHLSWERGLKGKGVVLKSC